MITSVTCLLTNFVRTSSFPTFRLNLHAERSAFTSFYTYFNVLSLLFFYSKVMTSQPQLKSLFGDIFTPMRKCIDSCSSHIDVVLRLAAMILPETVHHISSYFSLQMTGHSSHETRHNSKEKSCRLN